MVLCLSARLLLHDVASKVNYTPIMLDLDTRFTNQNPGICPFVRK
jgi:hypothetical protein